MLFYDQFGALGQFQGFNNVTHEYQINNIARNGASQFDGSINFMIGGTPRLKIDTTFGTAIPGQSGFLQGEKASACLLIAAGPQRFWFDQTNPTGTGRIR